MHPKRLIVLQNTWRSEDNPMLVLEDHLPSILLGCVDDTFANSVNGMRKRSISFEAFNQDCAYHCKQQLELPLAIYQSPLILVVSEALKQYPTVTILRLEEPVAINEQVQIDKIKAYFPLLKIELVWCNALYSFSQMDLPEKAFFKSFSHWRYKVEAKKLKVESLPLKINASQFMNSDLGLPEIVAATSHQHTLFKPGMHHARARLEHYLFDSHLIKNYKKNRNQLLGFDFSSKFSTWLAHGAISPKTIHSEITRYEEKEGENESTYWLKFELLWREFFCHAMRLKKRAFFLEGGLTGSPPETASDPVKLKQWCSGHTENHFINANMIELNLTGYMSNRGRQNVASYLIHDLKQDWRFGAAYFESTLLDYDVSSNWGNWAYIAGVGHSTRIRRFNVEKQQQSYDPTGAYTQYWLAQR